MAGSTAYSGSFVVSEVTFDEQRWFQLDPVKIVTLKEVGNPDLSRVDEIGFVDLMPGGGHGFAGCSNVSWIEVRDSTEHGHLAWMARLYGVVARLDRQNHRGLVDIGVLIPFRLLL